MDYKNMMKGKEFGHEKDPVRMKLQQDMPVGGDQSHKIHRCKMSDKGHVPMAKQEMMMKY